MKTILITGANRGIGLETARQLLKRGNRVILAGRSEEGLKVAMDRLSYEQGDAHSLVVDVSDDQSVNDAYKIFREMGLEIDVLINNAAILLKEDLSLSKDALSIHKATFETNVFGP